MILVSGISYLVYRMNEELKKTRSFTAPNLCGEEKSLGKSERIKQNTKYKIQNTRYEQKAFTLLEMLVAFAIFSAVMLSVTAVFIASLRTQRRSSGSEVIVGTVRFALEFMERELRTARRFADENGDGSVLKFCNDRGQIARYRVAASRFERKANGSGCAEGASEYETLTSPDVVISDFRFRLLGESDADAKQPRVTLSFKASPLVDPTIVFNFATTVSQRDLDIKK